QDAWPKIPVKPNFDGEPSYENIIPGLSKDPDSERWTADDVRRYAYWSVFAGGAGFAYGENSIMQMLNTGDTTANFAAKIDWRIAQDAPGAFQMQHVKDLILAQPSYFDRIPDQTLIAGENGERYDYITATRGAEFALFYTYNGRVFEVNMGKIAGDRVSAQWFNPRKGSYTDIGIFDNTGVVSFNPPGDKLDGNDWVLVLQTVK
ncbi:MAG: glycoside hydrolase family 140 protein, partial [Rikenellaceae bacterium]|nr:glycoside hydrolase family 140 protein [Rikenellaceae bacterium]